MNNLFEWSTEADHTYGFRWALLLGLLLASMALEPVLGESTPVALGSLALLQLSVVGALFVSSPPGHFRVLCLLVSIVWFVASIVALTSAPFHGLVAALSVLMLLASLIATFANLVKREKADFDSLLGGIYGYFLIGMIWAVLYIQIERWSPGSFDIPEGRDLATSMIYFSFVTLTTLGYGDILPSSPAAEFLAALQAAIGVLYIAVLIGSIVGSYQSVRRE